MKPDQQTEHNIFIIILTIIFSIIFGIFLMFGKVLSFPLRLKRMMKKQGPPINRLPTDLWN
jgi:hypothetical protein